MKRSATILISAFVAALATAGCNEHTICGLPPDPMVWDLAHSTLSSLNGNVASVREESTVVEGEEPTVLLTASFDERGMMTSFNDTGIYPEGVAAYGWGVESNYYDYGYDSDGRLLKAVVHGVGVTTTYTLTYGNHGRYVPMPFALGDRELFLVGNVTGVTGRSVDFDGEPVGSDFEMTCDGQTATYAVESWDGTQRYTYTFEGAFPEKCEVKTSERGTDISIETINYSWDALGNPTKIESLIVPVDPEVPQEDIDAQTERTLTEYAAGYIARPASKTVWYGGELRYKLNYSYMADGNLASVKYGPETLQPAFDVQECEYIYNGWDEPGNWTSCKKRITDMGVMDVTRTIVYR